MNITTRKPFVQVAKPADTRLYYAESALEHLLCWPESVVCMMDPEHNHDHLLDLQHWLHKGYHLAETRCIERESGAYRGVILYRPSDAHVRL